MIFLHLETARWKLNRGYLTKQLAKKRDHCQFFFHYIRLDFLSYLQFLHLKSCGLLTAADFSLRVSSGSSQENWINEIIRTNIYLKKWNEKDFSKNFNWYGGSAFISVQFLLKIEIRWRKYLFYFLPSLRSSFKIYSAEKEIL